MGEAAWRLPSVSPLEPPALDTLSLTYDELAGRLGIAVHSARNLVRRKRWSRTVGNDGKARVSVPLDALKGGAEDAPKATPEGAPEAPPEAPMMALLEAQIEGLKSLVEAERKRADAAEADRDRWHELATRSWWRKLVG